MPFMCYKRAREKDAIWQSHYLDAKIQAAGIPENILFVINVFSDSCQHNMSNSKVKVNLYMG